MNGFLARSREISDELSRERGRRRLRKCVAVNRHLAPRVVHLRSQVVAMQLAQLVAGNSPQPEKKWNRRLVDVFPEILPSFQVRILQDVGGVNTPLQSVIEAKRHHPVQRWRLWPSSASQETGSPPAASCRS